MNLKAIATKRLYQRVADQISQLIKIEKWKPGERLPSERDIAKQLGISRPVVREAMIALELMKLVEVRTGAGIFVAEPKNNITVEGFIDEDPGPSAFELIDARRVIEGETAAIAANSRRGADLAKLQAAIRKMDEDARAGQQSVTNQEDGDLLFHSAIAAVSHNAVLISIVDQLWAGMRSPLFKGIVQLVRLPENALKAVTEHEVIFQHIEKQDADGARLAMQQHLDQVRRALMLAK